MPPTAIEPKAMRAIPIDDNQPRGFTFTMLAWISFVLYAIKDCFVAFIMNIAPIGTFGYKDINRQLILITGGGGVLGRELAVRLAARGARIALWDLDREGLAMTAVQCASTEVYTYVVDMRSRESIRDAAAFMRKQLGDVDIVINNAGVGFGGKILEQHEEQIRTCIDVNYVSHFWMAREFLPAMLEKDSGHIVTVASLGGLFVSAQDMIPYCSSKFGALAVQEGLENEVACMGKKGIRFTTICPSFFQTKLMEDMTTRPGTNIMTPEQVANSAVDAILTEMRICLIPKAMYLLYAIKGILPRVTFLRLMTTFYRNNR